MKKPIPNTKKDLASDLQADAGEVAAAARALGMEGEEITPAQAVAIAEWLADRAEAQVAALRKFSLAKILGALAQAWNPPTPEAGR